MKPISLNYWWTCRECPKSISGLATRADGEQIEIEVDPHYCRDDRVVPGFRFSVERSRPVGGSRAPKENL